LQGGASQLQLGEFHSWTVTGVRAACAVTASIEASVSFGAAVASPDQRSVLAVSALTMNTYLAVTGASNHPSIT
jgi:hypothetical protein